MTRVWYCTRSDVAVNPVVDYPPDVDAAIAAAIEAASTTAEKLAGNREFHPRLGVTRYSEWPTSAARGAHTLYFDHTDFLSITTLVSGAETIAATDYDLWPQNEGPPYTGVRLDNSTDATWAAGTTDWQSIQATGTTGVTDNTTTAGTITANIADTTTTSITVSDPTVVDVGHLIKIGTEWMRVTGKSYVDSTATISAVTADVTDRTLTVSADPGLALGETIKVGFEAMIVRDVSGTSVQVERAAHGSQLTSHAGAAPLLRSTALTVERGSVGSTASTHTAADSVNRWETPPIVRAFTIAQAMSILSAANSGYAADTANHQDVDARRHDLIRYHRRPRRFASI